MRRFHRFSIPLLVAAAAALSVDARVARQITTPTTIEWQQDADRTVVLSVQRPDGEVVTRTFDSGRRAAFDVRGLADGEYSWELRDDSGTESGSFTVRGGTIVPRDLPETGVRPGRPAANPFYLDDVSAQGGVCSGLDCTDSESYGVATIKMKENNTRIKFEDTSGSGFPSTDWQLSANDMSSGGANKFFLEDLSTFNVPLLVEGGTPSNALYLDSTGRVGMRTSTPAKDLQITTGSSPTIRLEQTGASARSWDMFGNNFNYVVHDATAVTSPFIIRSGAPTGALTVDATARIGLGVAFPSYQIHHSSGARLDAGNWVNASSRAVKRDIHQLDANAALDALRALEPVTFAYTANPDETHVGFIAEDVPDLVATSDRKGLSSMDVVAVLTKVIQQQQRTIEEMRTRLDRLEHPQ
jgi:hypothetical protein